MTRAAVVAEARSWLGTPHVHHASVKGAGVDCGQLLRSVFVSAGVVPDFDPGEYPPDWMKHRSEEKFLGLVELFAHRIDGPPLPGDIALFRFGRCISHGALVVEWPTIIHSYIDGGVMLDNALVAGHLMDRNGKPRLAGFWSVWA